MRIEKIFRPSEIAKVEDYLRSECGDALPLLDSSNAELAERARFAVLKLSGGDYAKLQRCIEQAKVDWRDVLVAAGFGEDAKAHLVWNP